MMKYRASVQMRIVLALLAGWSVAAAGQREITFPIIDGVFTARPSHLAFTQDGELGFALVSGSDGSPTHLFSFSPAAATVTDYFDLSPDFGPGVSASAPRIALKVNGKSGVALIHGRDPNGIQKLVCLSMRPAGRFSRLWSISYPPVGGAIPQAAFNEDGSRIYVMYDIQSSAPAEAGVRSRVAVIGAADGVTIAESQPLDGGGSRSIVFDNNRQGAIAVTGGAVHLLLSTSEGLDSQLLSERIPQLTLTAGLDLSRDGRFLVWYGGYEVPAGNNSLVGSNLFHSYDLENKLLHTLSIPGQVLPSSESLSFHRSAGAFSVPYSVTRRRQPDGSFLLSFDGTRLTDIIALASDGTLTRAAGAKLPKRSASGTGLNLIGTFNNVAISATGVLGFIPSSNGKLFTFDTMTGEIVNDQAVDPDRLFFTQSIGPSGTLALSNGTNKLLLVGIDTAPLITEVKIRKSRTIIKGAYFLEGARVRINGEDAGPIRRSLDDPSHELTIEHGKRDFPHGFKYSVVVENRDGTKSDPFVLDL